MANLPRRFAWLGARGDHGTHLALEPGKVYPSSSVGDSLLIGWMREGKLKFVADEPGEALPPDVVLDVQKGTIPLKDLFDHIEAGLKKERADG